MFPCISNNLSPNLISRDITGKKRTRAFIWHQAWWGFRLYYCRNGHFKKCTDFCNRACKCCRLDGTASYIVAQPATCWTTLCPSSCCPPAIFGQTSKGTILKHFCGTPPSCLKVRNGWHCQVYSGTASYIVAQQTTCWTFLSLHSFFGRHVKGTIVGPLLHA